MAYLAKKLAMRKKPTERFYGVEERTQTSTSGNFISSNIIHEAIQSILRQLFTVCPNAIYVPNYNVRDTKLHFKYGIEAIIIWSELDKSNRIRRTK